MQNILSSDYYFDCKEFKNGTLEMVLKAIKPLTAYRVTTTEGDSYTEACKEMGMPVSVRTFDAPRIKTSPSPEKQQENHERAVRRSKQSIKELLQQMQADRLLTLTYRENMQDRERMQADFKRFVRLVREGWAGQTGYPDWKYVAVTEIQERGAYHVHCGVSGWQRITFLRAAWIKALGGQGYERGQEMPGNVDITSPRKSRWGTNAKTWASSKLAAYMTKYLSKTFSEPTKGQKRYFCSKLIGKPKKERFFLKSGNVVEAIKSAFRVVELHYGKTIDLSRSWISKNLCYFWVSIEGQT